MEQVFEKYLNGLDESIYDYISSLLSDAETLDEDLSDQLQQLLLSADFIPDEDEAQAEQLVSSLFDALRNAPGSKFLDATASPSDDAPKLLAKPVRFGGASSPGKGPAVDGKLGLATGRQAGPNGSGVALTQFGRNTELKVGDRKLTRKEKREEERRQKLQERQDQETSDALSYEKQLDAINALATLDLDAALEEQDGQLQDVHLSDFDLPNKGGSGNLLVNASVVFARARRYGLIGRNGVGKTSELKVAKLWISFLESVAQKKIFGMDKMKSCASLLVKQEIVGDDRSPMDWVLSSDRRKHMLKAQAERLQGLVDQEDNEDERVAGQLMEIYKRLEALESASGSTESRAHSILHGLGFSPEMQQSPTKSLSGGWRMRVAIACALFISPPLLLLDEPTNHLDIEAVLWLEDYLTKEFKGTVIIVSHDRHFLNVVATDIVHFNQRTLTTYKGNFVAFEKTMEEGSKRQARQFDAQEMKRKHLQEYITKHAQAGENGPKAARQRKSRMKKLERLGMEAAAENQGRRFKASYDGEREDVEEQVEEKKIVITFPEPTLVKGIVVTMDGVSFDYNPMKRPPLLGGIDFQCDQNSRIALLGRNGSGKSTFIKLFMGKLTPIQGWVHSPANFRIGYVAQHHLDQLDMNSSPLEFLLKHYPGNRSMSHENDMRRYLASFGLGGVTLPVQKIRTLSGGQKVRVVLAVTLYVKPNFLVLDEPTNHCSIELTNALIEAIKTYQGGLLIVSHDQHLLTSVCNDYFVCESGTVKKYEGSFNDYKKKILREREARN